MAKIGNETRLILTLAKERRILDSQSEPPSFREDEKLHEAYTMGLSEGQHHYREVLKSIVDELERG